MKDEKNKQNRKTEEREKNGKWKRQVDMSNEYH